MVVGKKAKSLITIVVWALAGLAFFYTVVQILNPREHMEDIAVYSADVATDIEYNVRLTNTPVYSRAKDADPAKYYIMPFTDYLNIDCSYSLNSNSEANLTTSSYITAFLVSYIEDGNNEVVLWKKEYTLSNLETNQVIGTSIEGSKNVKISFSEYTALIDQIYDVYNFKSSYYIMVVYTTEFTVEYGENIENKILQPYLRINIDDLLFNINENDIPSTKLDITKQIAVADIINWDLVIVGSTIFILLAVLAILLPTKIISSVQLSESAKKIKRINVRYSDRIVNIIGKPELERETVKVQNIEDIIKISDEIGQPIFSVNSESQVYYYILNSGVMYYIVIDNN